MPYPSTLSTFTDPIPGDRLNSPSHSSIETAQNTALEEVQNFVGTLSSAVGTLVYDIRGAGSNGGGHVQTANKGGTGQTSYTKGDLLVATSSSVIAKLGVSTDGFVLTADSNEQAGIKWSAIATSKVMIPKPLTIESSVIAAYTSSILAYAGLQNFQNGIVANKISFDVSSVLVQGTYNLGFYTDSGTLVSSVTTGTISANGVNTVNVSSVMLSPNNYYVMIAPVTGTANFFAWATADAPTTNLRNLVNNPRLSGTHSIVGGVLPSTFTPSVLTATANTITLRLDN